MSADISRPFNEADCFHIYPQLRIDEALGAGSISKRSASRERKTKLLS